jgi:hypothetical protein
VCRRLAAYHLHRALLLERMERPNRLMMQYEHESSNDEAAATRARALCNGHNVEVWEGSRWVATIKEYSAHSGAPLSRVLP